MGVWVCLVNNFLMVVFAAGSTVLPETIQPGGLSCPEFNDQFVRDMTIYQKQEPDT